MGRKTIVWLVGLGVAALLPWWTEPLQAESVRRSATPAPVIQEHIAKDVPYVPTPQPVVDAMLKLANVNSNDVLVDLGSGDGRIVITAVKKFGVKKAVGIEIDPALVAESRRNIQAAGVADRAEIIQQNLFEADLSKYTVITMYLLPSVNLRLRHKLLRLRPGTRIVSHAFDMGEWQPDKVEQVDGRMIYLWVVPPLEKVPPHLLKEVKE
ncbi:MAG: methyltransferase domain-containing protein [Gloeomargarita sp. SKYBB_i_bin120]|nr:methyltransferase domain-containing protein [Gloeomargarita sp. SKYG98]MCS7291883.1 methyltransferase domain-containing protein [Gloeomargarita sp. SKYB120]MDW8177443.1 methyltransferase domain-containing protein [Gloeomargarita sp. SKYBB_i_bin120]